MTVEAPPIAEPPAIHVDVEVLTEAPLHVGGRVTVHGPARLRVSTAVGVLPRPYVDVLNAIAIERDAYDATTASLIGAGLEDSLVWRTHVGWRPWERRGFFVSAGYGYVGLGGALTGSELIHAVTGEDVDLGELFAFSASATLHMADVTAGWEWGIGRHVVVRAELGGAFTLAAGATVTPEQETGFRFVDVVLEEAAHEAEDWLEDELEAHVHTPTIGLGVGWRF